MKRLKKIIFSIYIGLLFMPTVVYAAGSGSGPGRLENPLGNTDLNLFLTKLLDVVVQIAFPIIVLAIIYTGFLFVASRGNKDKLEEAKKAFLWTVIGSLVVLGAAVLSKAIQGTVQQLKTSAPIENIVVLNDSELNW